jgi:septum formation protein
MVVSESAPLILGSGSPRRREILTALGISIRVVPGDADETRLSQESPVAYLSRVARGKLEDVARRVPRSVPGILVADTIVVVDGDILGKPRHEEEAVELLSRLVGRSHVVHTRYAIATETALERPAVERTVESRVTMRVARAEEVLRYAKTGEGLDKAGAYAAQGIGAFLIERIEGSFSNVVGLPACEVVLDLSAMGLLSAFPITERSHG